jgi:hypothetical protein
MSENQQNDVPEDELEQTDGEPLPERKAMSTVPIGDPAEGFVFPPHRPEDF